MTFKGATSALAVLVVALSWAPATASEARRGGPADGRGVASQFRIAGAEAPSLPAVLSAGDALRYRRIFHLQEDGEWHEADHEIRRLRSRLLVGHAMAQRYLHPTKYRSKYAELKAWMAEYADHPDATRIYRLAMRRKPKDWRAPKPPVKGYLNGNGDEFMTAAGPGYTPETSLTRSQRARVRELERAMRQRIRRGWPTGALGILDRTETRRLFDAVRFDRLKADIAMGYFAYNKDEEAYRLAAAAAKRSGRYLDIAHWTAGIAAWRLDRLAEARVQFEALGDLEGGSPWLKSAGAFWAARAHLVLRRPLDSNRWLEKSARYPRTFYGLLARRQLGIETDFAWDDPAAEAIDFAALLERPGGRRAIALLQVGQNWRAERELRKLYPAVKDDAGIENTILALAATHDMPALAMRLGGMLASADGRRFDGARYPLPRWVPSDGYRLDRALLFAVARQESNFNPRAKSHAGARGLMQLMPRTASFVAADKSLRRWRGRYKLYDPAFNLSLGQRYIEHLLVDHQVKGDLVLLAAAYNGGPGKLARWRRKTNHQDDPLLFIESIPSPETRIFIERVLTNFWIYRHRLGQPTPSLDAIAAGRWPPYISLDGDTTRFAEMSEARDGED